MNEVRDRENRVHSVPKMYPEDAECGIGNNVRSMLQGLECSGEKMQREDAGDLYNISRQST